MGSGPAHKPPSKPQLRGPPRRATGARTSSEQGGGVGGEDPCSGEDPCGYQEPGDAGGGGSGGGGGDGADAPAGYAAGNPDARATTGDHAANELVGVGVGEGHRGHTGLEGEGEGRVMRRGRGGSGGA